MANSKERLNNLIDLYAASQNGLENIAEDRFLFFLKDKFKDEGVESFFQRLRSMIVRAISLELGRDSELFAGSTPFKVDARHIKEKFGLKD